MRTSSKYKKILLVRVPEVDCNFKQNDLRTVGISGLTVPLGVTYLASVIRSEGTHDVSVLDLYAEYYKMFINKCVGNSLKVIDISGEVLTNAIKHYDPDIVGFSASFLFQHTLVKKLITLIKDAFPRIRIYMGGYPTIVPEIVMNENPDLDVLFIGESERSILQVLNAEANQKNFSEVNGIAYRFEGKVIINNSLNLIENINEISYPLFDILPLKKYKKIFGRTELPILTSRSCPFSCNFCSSKLYSGRGFRPRSIKNILSELEIMKNEYDIEFLWIRDENFNAHRERAKNLLKAMMKNRLTVPWMDSNGLHVNNIDEELLDLCKESGCEEIIFPIESGSPRVLKDIMNKDVDLDHAKKMADHCHKIGLPLQGYFVIGNPGETKDEILRTIQFSQELGAEHCVFSIATPFPGTRYYDAAVKNGYLINDPEFITGMKYMGVSITTDEFSQQWLKDTQYDANIKVNFLGNGLLEGDKRSLEKALKKYSTIFKQYNFHVIARLLEGYINGRLGNIEQNRAIYEHVQKMLKDTNIAQAYSKYFEWDTPATTDYRRWAN